jgi:hypothetical protein
MTDSGPYPLEDEPAPPPDKPAWPDIVPDGPRCRRCGYDLKGLPMSGDCPECGLEVVRSLRGNLLEYSDPAYLRRLGTGALLVELGIVAICLVPIGAVGLLIIGMATSTPDWAIIAAQAGAALASIAAAVLGLVGLFVLTAPDPGHVGRDDSDRSRLATRIATIVCSACWALTAVVSALPTTAAIAPATFALLLRLSGLLLLASLSVQIIGSLYYLRHLARRVPDPRLSQDLTGLKSVAITGVICIALTVVVAMTRLLACFATVSGLVGLILFLVFLIRYADIVDRTRRHLRFIAHVRAELDK